MKLEFTHDDFAGDPLLKTCQFISPEQAAHMANVRLREMLDAATAVEGRSVEHTQGISGMWMWCSGHENGLADCTHRARLVCIEELPK